MPKCTISRRVLQLAFSYFSFSHNGNSSFAFIDSLFRSIRAGTASAEASGAAGTAFAFAAVFFQCRFLCLRNRHRLRILWVLKNNTCTEHKNTCRGHMQRTHATNTRKDPYQKTTNERKNGTHAKNTNNEHKKEHMRAWACVSNVCVLLFRSPNPMAKHLCLP